MDAKKQSWRTEHLQPFSKLSTRSLFAILTLFSSSATITQADNISGKLSAYPTNIQSNDTNHKQISILVNMIFNDPGFAKKTVRQIAYRQDDPSWVEHLPRLASNGFSSYKQKISLHNKNIQRIRAQRIDLYSSLKNKGIPDAEIFTSIMEFNNRLPIGYLKQTNMYDYVNTAIKVIHNQSQNR